MMYLGDIKVNKAYLGERELTAANAFIGKYRVVAGVGKIEYTTTDGSIAHPYNTEEWGAIILSNTYSQGKGTIMFDGPVTTVPTNCFKGNSVLNSLTIPNTVRKIKSNAFADTEALSYVTYDGTYAGWLSVTKEDGWEKNSNISFVRTDNGDVALYMDRVCYESIDGVKIIPHNSYGYRVKSNEYVGGWGTMIFDKTFWKVGSTPNSLFLGKDTMKTCVLPSYLGRVQNAIFKDCVNLERVTLPKNILYMENSIFNGCDSLDELYYLGNIEDWQVLSNNSRNWNYNSLITVVHCLDGDVTVEEYRPCQC